MHHCIQNVAAKRTSVRIDSCGVGHQRYSARLKRSQIDRHSRGGVDANQARDRIRREPVQHVVGRVKSDVPFKRAGIEVADIRAEGSDTRRCVDREDLSALSDSVECPRVGIGADSVNEAEARVANLSRGRREWVHSEKAPLEPHGQELL